MPALAVPPGFVATWPPRPSTRTRTACGSPSCPTAAWAPRASAPATAPWPLPRVSAQGTARDPRGWRAAGTASREGRVPAGSPHQPRCLWLRAESCAWDEHLCDRGLCLQLGFVCDGFHDCTDRSDEANCSLKHKGGRDRPSPAAPGPRGTRGWAGSGEMEGRERRWGKSACVCVCPSRMRGAADRLGGALVHPEPPPAIPAPAGERRGPAGAR